MRALLLTLAALATLAFAGTAAAEGYGYDCLEDLQGPTVVSDGAGPAPAPAADIGT